MIFHFLMTHSGIINLEDKQMNPIVLPFCVVVVSGHGASSSNSVGGSLSVFMTAASPDK